MWFLQLSSRLSEPIYDCDVSKDFAIMTDTANRFEEDLSLQVLPDFYPEHTNLAMNKKRRISVCDLNADFLSDHLLNTYKLVVKFVRPNKIVHIIFSKFYIYITM